MSDDTAHAAEKAWKEKIEAHRTAVENYVRSALDVGERDWQTTVVMDNWTPAQITEHLIRTYQVTLQELRGGPGVRPHYNFLLRPILRFTILPKIFRSRRIPAGAKAPTELMPEDSKESLQGAVDQLEHIANEFEREIFSRRNDKKVKISHHVFGAIELLEGLELATIHVDSHRQQLYRK